MTTSSQDTAHPMNKGSDAELLPCPFCGHASPEPTTDWHDNIVECGQCGARGGYGESEASAIKQWNTRALTKVEDTE